MSLKGQKCRGNLSGWRQNGVFSDMRIENKGEKFSRELDIWLISILWLKYGLEMNWGDGYYEGDAQID